MKTTANASTQTSENTTRPTNHGTGLVCLFLIGSVFIGTTAFYLNVPIPDGLQNPWQYRLLTGGKRVVSDMAAFQELAFGRPYPISLRNTVEMLTFPSPSEVEGSNILCSITAIAGVKVHLYEPIERKTHDGPALIFLHGGGFFFGSSDMWDSLIRRIAEELDILVVSLQTAFDDCYAVTKWILENAVGFGIDRTRVGISGDSAGGTLAAAVAQYIHDDNTLPDLKYQALIYPVSQLLDIETPAQQKYRRHFGENGGMITWWEAAALVSWYVLGKSDEEVITTFMENTQTPSQFWQEGVQAKFVNHTLVPEEFTMDGYYSPLPTNREGNVKLWSDIGSTLLDPRLCPLMRLNMSNLPPAFVATCEFDAMRDNGIYYVKRLEQDDVAVVWKHYEGGFHGVFGPSWPFTFKIGEQMFADYIQFIKSHW
ncbi:arylacetamide deacetylase-like [Amphiura filiformis]|uniref:arylacetamide deacetylase-like n=1 Tax=Amphiura filiformis TaxID=82378 RepID=UPI003B21783B